MKEINIDATDIFRQCVFKVANKDFVIDASKYNSFPSQYEAMEEFSKSVSQSFASELEKQFYEALILEFQKSQQ